MRYHLQRMCAAPHCVDSLLLYLNGPAKSDGTMLLWDVDGDGIVSTPTPPGRQPCFIGLYSGPSCYIMHYYVQEFDISYFIMLCGAIACYIVLLRANAYYLVLFNVIPC